MAVKGLVCELPPVDSGYRGEIHAIISNVSNQIQELTKGSRVGQLVIAPVVIADFVTDLGAERGTGGFGSTEYRLICAHSLSVRFSYPKSKKMKEAICR